MTDETRLHEMMADPGPAPEHDAHGWPDDGLSPGTVLLDSMKVAWQRGEDGNWQAIGGRLPLGGLPFYELDRRHDGDLTLIYMPGAMRHVHRDDPVHRGDRRGIEWLYDDDGLPVCGSPLPDAPGTCGLEIPCPVHTPGGAR